MDTQTLEVWWGHPRGEKIDYPKEEIIPPTATPASNNSGTHLRFYREVFSRETRIIDEINELDNRLRGSEPIWLHIYSGGGDLLTGFNIANAIQQTKTPVYAVIEGIVASAATLIACACAKCFMMPNAHFMIHQLSSATWGTHQDMKDQVEWQNTLMGQIEQFYLQNSNLSLEEIRDKLTRNTYIPANKALEWGFVDEIMVGNNLSMVTPVGRKPGMLTMDNTGTFLTSSSPQTTVSVDLTAVTLNEIEEDDDMAKKQVEQEAVDESADLSEQEEAEVEETSVRDQVKQILEAATQPEQTTAQEEPSVLAKAFALLEKMDARLEKMEARIGDLEGTIIDMATAMPAMVRKNLPQIARDLLSAEMGKSAVEKTAEKQAAQVVLNKSGTPTLKQQLSQRGIGGHN